MMVGVFCGLGSELHIYPTFLEAYYLRLLGPLGLFTSIDPAEAVLIHSFCPFRLYSLRYGIANTSFRS